MISEYGSKVGKGSLFAPVSDDKSTADNSKTKIESFIIPPQQFAAAKEKGEPSAPKTGSLFDSKPVAATSSLFGAPADKPKDEKPKGSLFAPKPEGEAKPSLFAATTPSDDKPSLFGGPKE
jgi:hypothetical protein